jgi:hypothetical protein
MVAGLAAGAPSAEDHAGIDAAMARMDGLWAQRDKSDALQELVAVGTNELALDPHSYDAEWRVARAYFWVAYTQPSRVAKKAMARTAMEWADHARTDRPDRVEGHYLFAIAAGEYADTIGAGQALVEGLAGKVESTALRAYAIDRDYSNGLRARCSALLFHAAVADARSERSRRYLERSRALATPGALIARLHSRRTTSSARATGARATPLRARQQPRARHRARPPGTEDHGAGGDGALVSGSWRRTRGGPSLRQPGRRRDADHLVTSASWRRGGSGSRHMGHTIGPSGRRISPVTSNPWRR